MLTDTKLTDTKELTNRIRGAGYTFEDVAERLGITRQALGNKINNRAEFKQGEISALQQMLNLNLTATNAIFFDVK
jgi:transcriptional regulator with XRE-family HTH domain